MATKPIVDVGQGFLLCEVIKLSYDMDGAAGAAGTYTGTVKIPAYAIIHDIQVHAVALWNAGTSAALDVGDDDDADGFFDAVNLKATDLTAGQSLSFAQPGGKEGAYVTSPAAGAHVTNRLSSSDRTITATVTTVGTAATTGETWISVAYALNPASVDQKLRGSYSA
mgnify:CR=1 FL=1